MRTGIMADNVKVYLSTKETYCWANRPGKSWPGSVFAGRRIFAEFDSNGLVDCLIDGRYGQGFDGNEFNAIIADHLRAKLPKEHKLYFVIIGQFDKKFDC